MRSRVLLIISIVEFVIIAVLAIAFFMPKQKPKLSKMTYEKQVDFLKENGVEEDEMSFAVECIAKCEENPDYVPFVMSDLRYYEIAEKVRNAVNNYYERNAEG